MELSTWLLFICIALAAIITPGPAVLLSVTNSLQHGVRKSVFSSLGNITGIFVISSVSVLSLGAVLQTSTLLFSVLKFFGALYLIYLGIRQWRSKSIIFKTGSETPGHHQKKRISFIQGLLVAISNPKAVIFFTAFFPQFIDLSKPIMLQFIILTATFMFFSFFILLIYALSAHSVKTWFAKGERAGWFNRVSGAIFIAFGLGILRLKSRTV